MSTKLVIRWTIRHELGHILGLKHTSEQSSIMNSAHYPGQNDVFSDLDKEALRFLHDERLPVFSNSDESRAILESILEINDNKTGKIKSASNFKIKALPTSFQLSCGN